MKKRAAGFSFTLGVLIIVPSPSTPKWHFSDIPLIIKIFSEISLAENLCHLNTLSGHQLPKRKGSIRGPNCWKCQTSLQKRAARYTAKLNYEKVVVCHVTAWNQSQTFYVLRICKFKAGDIWSSFDPSSVQPFHLQHFYSPSVVSKVSNVSYSLFCSLTWTSITS